MNHEYLIIYILNIFIFNKYIGRLQCRRIERIKNQRIGHILIVPTFLCSIIFFGCISVVLLIFAIAFLASAGGNKDFTLRYDNICQSQLDAGKNCTFSFTLPETMSSPRLYYQVENFYANHRQYVKSRSYPQLRGNAVSSSEISQYCSAVMYNKDVPVNKSYTGVNLTSSDIAYPCGLIGKYRFTDVFSLVNSNKTTVKLNMGDIAQTNDRDYKFINTNNPGSRQWLDFEEQRMMIWFQMESFPFFVKLYAAISGDLPSGTYTMTVSNQWDTQQFKAEKSIYFTTVNGLGGTNLFLGIVFLIFSIIVAIIIGVIVICECTRGSKPTYYSLENLKW